MNSKHLYYSLLFLIALTFSSIAQSNKNVILIIGDGMDDQQITIARNYLKGADGQLLLDSMPIRAAVQVQTVDDNDPSKFIYVADSANSASTIATGVVTSIGRVSTAAKTSNNLTTIIEHAQKAGYKTGIVSTASVTDGTPAAFIAHMDKRFCENPDIMAGGLAYDRFEVDCGAFLKSNGRPGSISEQLVDSDVDVILGGGLKHFKHPIEDGSNTLLEQAEKNGFKLITTKQQLLETTSSNEKLLGLFSRNTMPVRLQGEDGRIAEKPKRSLLNKIYKHIGDVTLPEPMRCEANPAFETMPELKTMTEIALSQLENKSGFFLIIESASIDKAAHRRDPCGSIGELEQLDETLAVALNFAKKSPNTLVLVTADHGQAAQLIPQVSMFDDPNFGGLPIATRGNLARLITNEGSIMGINYATNEGDAEEHTGVNVPLFANKGPIKPLITQADIFHIMMQHLGLTASN